VHDGISGEPLHPGVPVRMVGDQERWQVRYPLRRQVDGCQRQLERIGGERPELHRRRFFSRHPAGLLHLGRDRTAGITFGQRGVDDPIGVKRHPLARNYTDIGDDVENAVDRDGQRCFIGGLPGHRLLRVLPVPHPAARQCPHSRRT
jgi:hypothetical protein